MTTAQRQRRRARIRADRDRSLEALVSRYSDDSRMRRETFEKALAHTPPSEIIRMVALFHLAEAHYQAVIREACIHVRRDAERRAQGHKRERERALRQNDAHGANNS